jgi:hypothetical protein
MNRLLSFLATMAWCVVAVIWNLAVIGTMIRAVAEGKTWVLLVMVPFVLIGLFLAVVLFASVQVGILHLFKIGRPSPPLTNAEPHDMLPMRQPVPSAASLNDFNPKASPIIGTLLIIAFVNWFVFFGISMYLGGDALGILPSKDGFVVTSHGRHTAVSESAWVFSLFYSSATLLLSPLIGFLFVALQTRRRLRTTRWPLKLFAGLFCLVWTVGWYWSIGSSFFRSREDWQKLKHKPPASQTTRHVPQRTLE